MATDSSAAAAPSSRPVPVREDCWSQEASSTLIEAWGRRYVELNRGNLRQKDWQMVADLVNSRHGHSKKTYRTDVQCKNRIDTIKKKYKVEKARVSASGGMVGSLWPFYDRLDELIGSSLKKAIAAGGGVSVSVSESVSHSPPMALMLPHYYRTPVEPMATAVLSKKRPSPAADDSYFRRNYSAVAAAAAAAASTSTDDDENEDEDDEVEVEVEVEVEEEEEAAAAEEEEEMPKGWRGKDGSEDGIRKLAMAIRRFGDVYAKVEAEKQNQMIEMEKQRIQFSKDLEVQRMQMYVNMQLQLKKIKIDKPNRSNGGSN